MSMVSPARTIPRYVPSRDFNSAVLTWIMPRILVKIWAAIQAQVAAARIRVLGATESRTRECELQGAPESANGLWRYKVMSRRMAA